MTETSKFFGSSGPTPTGMPNVGAATAAEIYVAAGSALSWWEAAEDIRLGIYRSLVSEPKAVNEYLRSPARDRAPLLMEALRTKSAAFEEDELAGTQQGADALDHLRTRRTKLPTVTARKSSKRSVDGR